MIRSFQPYRLSELSLSPRAISQEESNVYGCRRAPFDSEIGSSQRAISAYETVAEYPPTAVVVELARGLKVSADELLGLEPPPKAARAAAQDPETRRLWRKFQQVRALPEKDQRAVIRLVNSLVSAKAR